MQLKTQKDKCKHRECEQRNVMQNYKHTREKSKQSTAVCFVEDGVYDKYTVLYITYLNWLHIKLYIFLMFVFLYILYLFVCPKYTNNPLMSYTTNVSTCDNGTIESYDNVSFWFWPFIAVNKISFILPFLLNNVNIFDVNTVLFNSSSAVEIMQLIPMNKHYQMQLAINQLIIMMQISIRHFGANNSVPNYIAIDTIANVNEPIDTTINMSTPTNLIFFRN